MEIKNTKVLVIGSARSGLGAARLAGKMGAKVSVYDQKSFENLSAETQQYINELKSEDIRFLLNEEVDSTQFELLIVSPGVPLEIDIIEKAKKTGIEVVGEFEFASRYCKAPIVSITGTNGKTTTTMLVGEIIKKYNEKTYVVGNIGRAFSEDVLEIEEDGVVVAEVSSFQLETVKRFHSHVGALLNITPDHLNRHKTMENYCHAKYQVFKNQTLSDYAILNIKDEYYEEAKGYVPSQIITFSSIGEVDRGAYLKEQKLYHNINGHEVYICHENEIRVFIENALAAIAITVSFGVPEELITNVLTSFKGVEHRIEYVCTKKGVDIYNDSKATNTDAAIKGILTMKKPIRLLAGGMDKKVSFKDWIKLFEGKVKKVYVIGETKLQIIQEAKEEGYTHIVPCLTFEEAIQKAYEESSQGECILLSPACASWDMFESYEQRGDIFKTIINSMEG
ncbi:MAG: UDP-N-acetylmuramoyl-L-alanine--D-glutamate ligase [Cellulosilyticaceae bacterium]